MAGARSQVAANLLGIEAGRVRCHCDVVEVSYAESVANGCGRVGLAGSDRHAATSCMTCTAALSQRRPEPPRPSAVRLSVNGVGLHLRFWLLSQVLGWE